jgi:hypothetical protein
MGDKIRVAWKCDHGHVTCANMCQRDHVIVDALCHITQVSAMT